MAYVSFPSPFGPLTLFEEDGHLVALEFGRAPNGQTSTPLLDAARQQLDAYFNGKLTSFDLPMTLRGTDFQRRVWDAMARLPYGQTATYGELAKSVGSAARAVGGACGANPLPIIVPCHRIVSQNGALGGYSGGGGKETKAALLRLEGAEPGN